ncbi:MAG: ABC transporter permease [Acidobacteria bacterium]|jgi:ABC-2 type transport system permease protein|nr:ABC transporter permease [Acidobacteriota bacterium]
MIRWEKVRAVAGFEFLSTVKRPGWLIATFGMPLILGFWGLIGVIPGFFIHQKESEIRVFGVVDKPGVMRLSGDTRAPLPELPAEAREALKKAGQASAAVEAVLKGNAIFRPVGNEDEARQDLTGERLAGYFVLPEDYLASGRVESYMLKSGPFGRGETSRQFGELIKERLLEGRVPPEFAARVRQPVADARNYNVELDGAVTPRDAKTEIARLLVPVAFAVLLFSALMGTAGYLLQAVAVEKENRVVEVLLSSASPDEILGGKLLGLGAAGLLQIGAWVAMLAAGAVGFAGLLVAFGISIPWLSLALAIPFFLAAYMFTGSLMLGLSSLGGTMREAQQWSAALTIPTVVPLMMFGVILAEPNGLVPTILTFIPFTAPLTVLMRAALEPAGFPWWQIALSFAVMVVSTVLALKLGARLFRVGLLLTGSRPSLAQLWRQARLARGKA